MKQNYKHLFIILLTCLINLAISATAFDSGVSRELADRRRSTITDVVYNLSLDVSSKDQTGGKLGLIFNYHPDNKSLELDFDGESVSHIVINNIDQPLSAWSDGHIVIAPEFLSAGQNHIEISFISKQRALNRNPDYLYTLFVPNRAHSVFPCFDQPNIKAVYNLSLTVPAQWKAVSNSPVIDDKTIGNERTVRFAATEPLSTYLFAFAAGEFEYRQHSRNGRTIGAYYRETDKSRLAQLDEIFNQVHNSLNQLETYTGIPYPFAKYDLVILPGFQFGGMEHTGATFYNDNVVFVPKNATSADFLRRATVIAHETAHMWFGDYVTMDWFDDVWTKEVFANYFAARLTRELLPQFDHDLEWLRVYMSSAIDQDMTGGTTPIKQQLDNLRDAGLIYNDIIYNKSPLMINKLAKITGDENFKLGIRKYLSDHAYGNATWDDVVSALEEYSEADLSNFSRVWVYEKGMPEINFDFADGTLIIRQIDPLGRKIVWPQSFNTALYNGHETEYFDVVFDGTTDRIEIDAKSITDASVIIPSANGEGYGFFTVDNVHLSRLMADALTDDGVISQLQPVGRLATLMMLNENYLANNIETCDWLNFIISYMKLTDDSQTLTTLARYLSNALLDLRADEAAPFEAEIIALSSTHSTEQGRLLALRSLITTARNAATLSFLYDLWQSGETSTLDTNDLNDMAIELAIMMPGDADEIIATQRARNTDSDRLRKFDFLSRATTSDEDALDALFESLRDPQNRLIEPWTRTLLALLNHHSRQEHSVNYIIPALDMLPEIQSTGDIFFPSAWSNYLLSSYRSAEAAKYVNDFLVNNASMNPLLLNKVRQSAWRLMQKQR